MKIFPRILMLVVVVPVLVAAANKTLANDPLTGLPLISWPDRLGLGNAPMRLEETTICKSKMQTDFYTPNGIKVAATVSWYSSKLSGFKRVHGYVNKRSQDIFYKTDGSVIVSIAGIHGNDGEDTDVHGIVYETFQPALSEKTIVGMNTENIVCP